MKLFKSLHEPLSISSSAGAPSPLKHFIITSEHIVHVIALVQKRSEHTWSDGRTFKYADNSKHFQTVSSGSNSWCFTQLFTWSVTEGFVSTLKKDVIVSRCDCGCQKDVGREGFRSYWTFWQVGLKKHTDSLRSTGWHWTFVATFPDVKTKLCRWLQKADRNEVCMHYNTC